MLLAISAASPQKSPAWPSVDRSAARRGRCPLARSPCFWLGVVSDEEKRGNSVEPVLNAQKNIPDSQRARNVSRNMPENAEDPLARPIRLEEKGLMWPAGLVVQTASLQPAGSLYAAGVAAGTAALPVTALRGWPTLHMDQMRGYPQHHQAAVLDLHHGIHRHVKVGGLGTVEQKACLLDRFHASDVPAVHAYDPHAGAYLGV